MSKIPPELLQKIKDAVNIVDVVGEHVVLRKSGSNFTGLCPFHSERSPSFSVSENKQVYHCYGCKAGGDIVTFISQMHGLSFIEAIQELADRAKISLPAGFAGGAGADDPERAQERDQARERLALAHRLNRFVAAVYRKNLESNGVPGAEDYLKSRGLDAAWERSFYVGAVSNAWDTLAQKLVQSKAPLELAQSLGLIRPSPQGTAGGRLGYFDLFRGRVMFPILDLRGKVAGFGGRLIPGFDSEMADKTTPKYLNSPESMLFHKSKLAFGLYQAQKHVREKDEVILVEGYFDVIALHRAGFENAVATCGTTLSPDHLAVFRRLGARVTLLFDGDRAGQQAMDRAMVTALEQGSVVYGAFLPEGVDPDELVLKGQSGIEELKGLLSAARPLIDVRIEQACREGASGVEARVQAIRQVGGWLSRFRDPVGKAVRLESFCKTLGVSPALVEQTMRESDGQSRRAAPETKSELRPPVDLRRVSSRPNTGPVRKAKLTPNEKLLLRAIVRWEDYSEIFSTVPAKLPPEMTFSGLFQHEGAQKWVATLLDPGHLEEGLNRLREIPESLLELSDDLQVRSIISEALVAEDLLLQEEQVNRAVSQRLGQVWARFSQRLKQALAEAEAKNDMGLHSKLMKDYLDVQKKMKEFNNFYDKA